MIVPFYNAPIASCFMLREVDMTLGAVRYTIGYLAAELAAALAVRAARRRCSCSCNTDCCRWRRTIERAPESDSQLAAASQGFPEDWCTLLLSDDVMLFSFLATRCHS